MTVERARELIGREIENLLDEEVLQMIQRDSAFMEEMLNLLTTGIKGGKNGVSD